MSYRALARPCSIAVGHRSGLRISCEANQLEGAGDDDLLEEYDKGLDQEWSCWEMVSLVPYKGLVVLLPLGAASSGCFGSQGSRSSS